MICQRKRGASFIVDYQPSAVSSRAAHCGPYQAAHSKTVLSNLSYQNGLCSSTNYLQKSSLIPPKAAHLGKLTVVLDLDETLVYARSGPLYVRPGVELLMSFLRDHCETIVWTAALSCYAAAVVSEIDPARAVSYTISRDSCRSRDGSKDIKLLHRDLDYLILIDNTPDSIRGNECNSVLVDDYEGGELEDLTLVHLVEFLTELVRDIERGGTVPQFIEASSRVHHRLLPTDSGEIMRCPCLVSEP